MMAEDSKAYSPACSSQHPYVSITRDYERFIFEPSEFHENDDSSQVRWQRASRIKCIVLPAVLEQELEEQRRKDTTISSDFKSMSKPKREQICQLLDELRKSNPDVIYDLAALKLIQEQIDSRDYVRWSKCQGKVPDHKKKRTVRMNVIIERKTDPEQMNRQCHSRPPIVRRHTGSSPAVYQHNRPPLSPKETTGSATPISASNLKYIPTRVLREQGISRDSLAGLQQTSSVKSLTDMQRVLPLQAPTPIPLPIAIPKVRPSKEMAEPSPTHSGFSTSWDSSDPSSPIQIKKEFLSSPNGQPRKSDSLNSTRGSAVLLEPKPPKVIHSEPEKKTDRGDIGDECVPRMHYSLNYISKGCQTENWRSSNCAGEHEPTLPLNEKPKISEGASQNLHDGYRDRSESREPAWEDDSTSIDDSGPDEGTPKDFEKDSRSETSISEKPSWMNNLVPVTPSASTEAQESPYVGDETDALDQKTNQQETKSIQIKDSDNHPCSSDFAKPESHNTSGKNSVPNTLSSSHLPYTSPKDTTPVVHQSANHQSKSKRQFSKSSGHPSPHRSGSFERLKPKHLSSTASSPGHVSHYVGPRPAKHPAKSVRFSLPPTPESMSASPTSTPSSSRSSSPDAEFPPHVSPSLIRLSNKTPHSHPVQAFPNSKPPSAQRPSLMKTQSSKLKDVEKRREDFSMSSKEHGDHNAKSSSSSSPMKLADFGHRDEKRIRPSRRV